MKKKLCTIAAVLLMTSCHNANNQELTTDSVSWNGVTVLCESDQCQVIGLVDMENEMSIDLFRGSYNDSLLEALMPTGSLPSAINAYLVTDDNHRVLFDAGLGADKGGQLMDRLKNHATNPDSIDAVCITHLHADHIGGLLLDGNAAFPNAILYLSKEENEAFCNNDLWLSVSAAYQDRIVMFQDGDTLLDGLVVAKLAPGHTPGHTVYVVDGGLCYIVGDLLHAQDLQIDHPEFCARYDMDPDQARTTRRYWLDFLRNDSGYMSGAHCYDHFLELTRQ